MTASLSAGLCSVTFRHLDTGAVVELAASAGLEGVEWGGDVHVPPGDPASARSARRRTEDAGLFVASYGSYLFADAVSAGQLDPVLATASELGTDLVRVWCPFGMEPGAPEPQRAEVAAVLARWVDQAAAVGISLYLEFHGGTLTASAPSARALLDAVGDERLRCGWQRPYWDPPAGEGLDAADELALLEPWLAHVHVYEWVDTADTAPARGRRRPLARRPRPGGAVRSGTEPSIRPARVRGRRRSGGPGRRRRHPHPLAVRASDGRGGVVTRRRGPAAHHHRDDGGAAALPRRRHHRLGRIRGAPHPDDRRRPHPGGQHGHRLRPVPPAHRACRGPLPDPAGGRRHLRRRGPGRRRPRGRVRRRGDGRRRRAGGRGRRSAHHLSSYGLAAVPEDELPVVHAALADACDQFLGFELGRMFHPAGRIWTLDTYAAMLEIPAMIGAKHSSLSRRLELDRLAVRDERRPGFMVLTGNDLAIDLVTEGSDYSARALDLRPRRLRRARPGLDRRRRRAPPGGQ